MSKDQVKWIHTKLTLEVVVQHQFSGGDGIVLTLLSERPAIKSCRVVRKEEVEL